MITSEHTPQGWRHYTLASGHLFSRLYIGYTKRDSLREFKRELRGM